MSIMQKVVQTLKIPARPKEILYFKATPKMLERFRYLLGLASAFDFSESKYLGALLFGQYREPYKDLTDRETTWRNFQVEIEQNFGRIASDSDSTLATMDDNPGAGRLIDKFLYQPIGRSIEGLFLNWEIRFFHPPEKSARRIKRFLEGSEYFGNLVPVDEIFDHEIFSDDHYRDKVNFNEACVSLFLEISQKEEIAKAFQRLLMQASSKNRSLRVEAQKEIWSLFRYKNMAFIMNAITDLASLLWEGATTTFQHCSPLDPDFQTHLCFIMQMDPLEKDELLVDAFSNYPEGPLLISSRDILETCAQENRGFSSLPINLVIRLFAEELHTYVFHEEKLEETKEFAENLYLALIAIIGFCNEFSYASKILSMQIDGQYRHRLFEAPALLPLWEKDRTESDINALELMVHFTIYLMISIPYVNQESYAVHELEIYMELLNDADKGQGTMSIMEARASEDYLRKVTEGLVQRGPISFATFKEIVTNPLTWEKYHRPERKTEATNESRSSTTWKYDGLRIDTEQFLNSSIPSFFYIPFSDSFQAEHFDKLVRDRNRGMFWLDKKVESLFRIWKWLEELEDASITLSWDRPGTELYRVMKWWYSYDIEMYPIIQEARRELGVERPYMHWIHWTLADMDAKLSSDIIRSYHNHQRRSSPKLEDGRTSHFGNEGVSATPDSPCFCRICERMRCKPRKDESVAARPVLTGFTSPSPTFEAGTAQTEVERVPTRIEEHALPLQKKDVSSQHRRQHNPVTEHSPVPSCFGFLKRKLEEEEPRPQLVSDIMQSYPSYQRRSSPKLESDITPHFGTKGVSARPDPPCLCHTCLRNTPKKDESGATRPALTRFTSPSPRLEAGPAQTEVERVSASIEEHSLPHQTKDVSSQHRRQHNNETGSSPLPSRYGRLKRKFGEEEPRPQIVPLPRRYRDNKADNTELRTLGPVRKKQSTSLSLESDASDVDAIITEVDEDSTESDTRSEDAMSMDEDFWSAKSKLSLLAIED